MGQQNPTVMISLGGNAISPKNESGTIQQQFAHTKESLAAVMGFVKRRYNICIAHGNGPQVGAELQRNELTQNVIPPLPLGVLVANTQGRDCSFRRRLFLCVKWFETWRGGGDFPA